MNGGEKCNRSSQQHRHPAYGGRPRIDDRRVFAAMIYVLRTGIHTNYKWAQLGSNQRPISYEPTALTTELWALVRRIVTYLPLLGKTYC